MGDESAAFKRLVDLEAQLQENQRVNSPPDCVDSPPGCVDSPPDGVDSPPD
jgi:hypothetical protein